MQNTRKNKVVGATVASVVLVFGGLGGCGKSPETLTADARQFIQKGDNKAAVIQLKNALLKNPSDVEARLTLGNLYNKTGDPVSAEKELRKAASLGASADKTMPGIAAALFAQNELQKLLDETEPGLATASAEVLTARGDAFLALGKSEQAEGAYRAALAAAPNHPRAVIGTARLALMGAKVEEATRIAGELVSTQPNSADAWNFQASVLRAQGKKTEAIAAYDKALALEPEQRNAHVEKAFILIDLRQFDAARKEIASARNAGPNTLMVTYAQGLLDLWEGKHEAARDTAQKILGTAPGHMPSVLLAGAAEYHLGSAAAAVQHLKQYMAAVPGNDYARKLYVASLLKLGRTADALAALEPALRAKDPDEQYLTLAGEANMQAREFDKAAAYFERATVKKPDQANLHTAIALSKLGKGDRASAIEQLEVSAKLDPTSRKAGMLLALTEMRMKRYDKALAAANALEKQFPNDAVVHNLKGGIYLAKSDLANGKASLEKALVLQPGFFPAAVNLAQLYLNQNNPAAAKQQLLAFLEKNKGHGEAMNALAQLAVAARNNAEAGEWLEKAAAAKPNEVRASAQLASFYLKSGEKQKALTLARKLAASNPTHTDVLDLLGAAQMANGDFAGAVDTYSKLASAAPKSAVPRMRLANAEMARNNPAAAAAELKRAMTIDPGFIDAQVALAELAMKAGKHDEGIAIARQVQKQRPKAAVGFLLEGSLLEAQRKPALAVRPFEQALALGPNSSTMILLHGAMTRAGKAGDADARLAKWRTERPADAALMIYVSELAINKKDFPGAIRHLETVVKAAPKHAAALNNLAWAYQRVGDPRALATAEQALALSGGSPAVLDTIGFILVEQGNTARGVGYLQQAVKLAPKDPGIRFHLAQGLAKSGDKANARRELEKVLLSHQDFAEIDAAKGLYKQL
ncbi:XrtA/PEP-CTERM system TPR-repeat protein PrsT [Massilia cavernae]|nr:XrtA/PEP-CTERM system TPR-repeat protein PrsT [Massilia cavernae]